MDTVDRQTRSRIMSRVKDKDTAPELIVRKGLHVRGFRFRLHCRDLPGRPDIVLPKHRAVVLVHGCFWHGHNCPRFKWPKSRVAWWRTKIRANRVRDKRNQQALLAEGWRVLEIWECALTGRMRLPKEDMLEQVEVWLKSDSKYGFIRGEMQLLWRPGKAS